MVRLGEIARFDKNSIIGEMVDLEEVKQLHYPGENYYVAAKLAWLAMRNTAVRVGAEPMLGDDNRPGYLLKGMGIMQAIELLWPTLSTQSKARTRVAIHRYFIRGNNAICLKQGKWRITPEWWVADEWDLDRIPSTKKSRERKRKPIVTDQTEPRVNAIITTQTAERNDSISIKTAMASVQEALEVLAMTVDSVNEENERLVKENHNLHTIV